MVLSNPYQAYKNQHVMLASPEELTLMLYSGCIRFIGQAEMAVGRGDIQGANEAIQRAQDILQELLQTLNMEIALSSQLAGLYDYLLWKLTEANMTKDAALLNEALVMVTELRDTWSEAMAQTTKKVSGIRG